jgi:hypothetical protein
VSVEFEEVVRGGDQSPFCADRGATSASEAVDAVVELGARHAPRVMVCMALALGERESKLG